VCDWSKKQLSDLFLTNHSFVNLNCAVISKSTELAIEYRMSHQNVFN